MIKPDFVAIDFEHATSNRNSVCAVGLVSFKNGIILEEYESLIKPPDNKYGWMQKKVHGINEEMTKYAPSFKEIYPEIKRRIENNIVVAHNAFSVDKNCLESAMVLNDITNDLNIQWKCTMSIYHGVRLDVACKSLNIPLTHHQVLSDARACGLLYAQKENIPIEEAVVNSEKKVDKRLTGPELKTINCENSKNPFFSKNVVISGFSNTHDYNRIAIELRKLGANLATSVSKKTNILITGENVGPSKLEKIQINIVEGRDALILSFKEYEEKTYPLF